MVKKMPKMKLADLLAPLEHCSISGTTDIDITGLTNNSREATPGSLFIAIRGTSLDGHDYIGEAAAKGAAAVVAEKPVDFSGVPLVLVPDARKAQAAIAARFYNFPSRSLTVTGITGTNGKTTSTFMVDSILQAAGRKTGLTGTLYNKIGRQIMPTVNTTPDSILCQQLLRQMADAGVTHVTMEISSHAMVMHRADHVAFQVGAITNFSPDHLDLHGSLDSYRQAKQRFFTLLPAGATAIANMDDPAAADIAAAGSANPLYYAIDNPQAHIRPSSICQDGKTIRLTVAVKPYPGGRHSIEKQQLQTELRLPGRHNLANALLAVAVALSLGIDADAISLGLSRFRGLFRRYEIIWDQGFRVIDDATHNPANMDAVFQTLQQDCPGRLTVVYGIRGNRGVEINKAIAGTLRRWTDQLKPGKLIVTRCDDTASPLDRVLPAEEQAFRQELNGLKAVSITWQDSLRDAVRSALNNVRPKDTLLLMGAHPMDDVWQIFAEEIGEELSILPRPPRFGSASSSGLDKIDDKE